MNESQANRVRGSLKTIESVATELECEMITTGDAIKREELASLCAELGILTTVKGVSDALGEVGSYDHYQDED